MVLNKQIPTAFSSSGKIIPIRGFAMQLEGLYARRSAVETLIQSLEDYQRSRVKRYDLGTLKTA